MSGETMEGSGASALASDLIAGKEEAFARLYDRIGPRLLRVAHTICRSHADAEDVVQDAFVSLVRMGSKLAGVRNVDAYLFSSVHRAASARVQRMKREKSVEGLDEIEEPVHESACDDRLERALSMLPPEQRTVLALKIDGELTFEEIATVLDIEANTAASRYRYALEKLRAVLVPDASLNASQVKRHEHGIA